MLQCITPARKWFLVVSLPLVNQDLKCVVWFPASIESCVDHKYDSTVCFKDYISTERYDTYQNAFDDCTSRGGAFPNILTENDFRAMEEFVLLRLGHQDWGPWLSLTTAVSR